MAYIFQKDASYEAGKISQIGGIIKGVEQTVAMAAGFAMDVKKAKANAEIESMNQQLGKSIGNRYVELINSGIEGDQIEERMRKILDEARTEVENSSMSKLAKKQYLTGVFPSVDSEYMTKAGQAGIARDWESTRLTLFDSVDQNMKAVNPKPPVLVSMPKRDSAPSEINVTDDGFSFAPQDEDWADPTVPLVELPKELSDLVPEPGLFRDSVQQNYSFLVQSGVFTKAEVSHFMAQNMSGWMSERITNDFKLNLDTFWTGGTVDGAYEWYEDTVGSFREGQYYSNLSPTGQAQVEKLMYSMFATSVSKHETVVGETFVQQYGGILADTILQEEPLTRKELDDLVKGSGLDLTVVMSTETYQNARIYAYRHEQDSAMNEYVGLYAMDGRTEEQDEHLGSLYEQLDSTHKAKADKLISTMKIDDNRHDAAVASAMGFGDSDTGDVMGMYKDISDMTYDGTPVSQEQMAYVIWNERNEYTDATVEDFYKKLGYDGTASGEKAAKRYERQGDLLLKKQTLYHMENHPEIFAAESVYAFRESVKEAESLVDVQSAEKVSGDFLNWKAEYDRNKTATDESVVMGFASIPNGPVYNAFKAMQVSGSILDFKTFYQMVYNNRSDMTLDEYESLISETTFNKFQNPVVKDAMSLVSESAKRAMGDAVYQKYGLQYVNEMADYIMQNPENPDAIRAYSGELSVKFTEDAYFDDMSSWEKLANGFEAHDYTGWFGNQKSTAKVIEMMNTGVGKEFITPVVDEFIMSVEYQKILTEGMDGDTTDKVMKYFLGRHGHVVAEGTKVKDVYDSLPESMKNFVAYSSLAGMMSLRASVDFDEDFKNIHFVRDGRGRKQIVSDMGCGMSIMDDYGNRYAFIPSLSKGNDRAWVMFPMKSDGTLDTTRRKVIDPTESKEIIDLDKQMNQKLIDSLDTSNMTTVGKFIESQNRTLMKTAAEWNPSTVPNIGVIGKPSQNIMLNDISDGLKQSTGPTIGVMSETSPDILSPFAKKIVNGPRRD